MKEKLCTMCGLSFPKTETYFYKAWERNGVIYFRGMCIECYKISSMNYYDKNRGRILDNHKEYYKRKK